MASSAELGVRVKLYQVVACLTRLIGVREEIRDVSGPGGEVGLMRVISRARVGALDEVS